jgi:hypothetical protein
MELLTSQFGGLSIAHRNITEAGMYSIRMGNISAVEYSINHGAHLEDLLTEAIKYNKLEITDLLLSHGATVFPCDINLAASISLEMYYLVTKHPGLLLNNMINNLQINY